MKKESRLKNTIIVVIIMLCTALASTWLENYIDKISR